MNESINNSTGNHLVNINAAHQWHESQSLISPETYDLFNTNDILPVTLNRLISCEDNLKASIESWSLDNNELSSFLEQNIDEICNISLAPMNTNDNCHECSNIADSMSKRRDVYHKLLRKDATNTSMAELTKGDLLFTELWGSEADRNHNKHTKSFLDAEPKGTVPE